MSQRRTWPEYVPPKMREGWNGENLETRMSEGAWNTYSGRECRWRFQIWRRPEGSCGAEGFLVEEERSSSGN